MRKHHAAEIRRGIIVGRAAATLWGEKHWNHAAIRLAATMPPLRQAAFIRTYDRLRDQ